MKYRCSECDKIDNEGPCILEISDTMLEDPCRCPYGEDDPYPKWELILVQRCINDC